MTTETLPATVLRDEPISHSGQLQKLPELSVDQLVARVEKIREVFARVMVEGVHYGLIPGTSRVVDGREQGKKTLLKPGAEILCLTFQLNPQFDHGIERDGRHLTVYSKCTLYTIGADIRLGSGNGTCSTRESKYAWRQGGRVCPDCEGDFIKRSKFPDKETGDKGWYCFQKVGGCGSQFRSDDPRMEQEVGRIENPDLPDIENTVVKMADKRSLIAATLIVTGASSMFTQDLEDQLENAREAARADDGRPTREQMEPREAAPPAAAPANGKKRAPAAKVADTPHVVTGPEYVKEVLVVRVDTAKSPTGIPFASVTFGDAEGATFAAITYDVAVSEYATQALNRSARVVLADKKLGEKEWIGIVSIEAAMTAQQRKDIPF